MNDDDEMTTAEIEAQLADHRQSAERVRKQIDAELRRLATNPTDEDLQAGCDVLRGQISAYEDALKMLEAEKPKRSRKDRFLVAMVWVCIIALFAWLLWQPADKVRIEAGGQMFLVQRTWWGLSTQEYPLRLKGAEWEIRLPSGEWIEYTIEPPDPGERGSPW